MEVKHRIYYRKWYLHDEISALQKGVGILSIYGGGTLEVSHSVALH